MNNDLKTLAKTLKDTTLAANRDLSEIAQNRDLAPMLPGHTMMKNQAIEKLPELRKQYREALTQNVFVFLPLGAGSDRFAEFAKSEGNAMVVDGSEFYTTLAKRCQETMGNTKTFGLTQFLTLQQELKVWARASDVNLQPLSFSFDTITPTLADVVKTVREIVEKSNGQSLIKSYIEEQVVTTAMNQEVDSKVVPVVILNAEDTQSHSDYFRGKGLIVDTSTNVTEEFVNKTFKQALKILKGKE